jgi:hypothetical protein
MVDEFLLYLRLGLGHITDLAGYDHILFVLATCAAYQWKEWRRVALLVTAFTVGHSITLALATLGLVRVRSDLVEFLIPCTIVATCLATLAERPASAAAPRHRTIDRYLLTVAFGCIHGLGFSSYLSALLGGEQSIVLPLFAFNVGLEVGQLFIVAFGLTVALAVVRIMPAAVARQWPRVLSVCIGVVASWLAVQRSIF